MNVQDNAVCLDRVTIGPYATVGHAAIVHRGTVGERVFDGSTVGVNQKI